MSSATGESTKHSGPSWNAQATNSTDETITNTMASPRDIRPRGSSRIAVRGLRASKPASTRRLNPIAALRAVTIAATIHATRAIVSGTTRAARIAPTSANGSANTEWLTRTNDAYVRTRESINLDPCRPPSEVRRPKSAPRSLSTPATLGPRTADRGPRTDRRDVRGGHTADQVFFHIARAGRG